MKKSDREQIFEIYSKLLGFSWWDRFYFNVKYRKGNAMNLAEKFIPKHGLIIDVGCGTGLFDHLLVLKSSKRHVIGVDLDKKRVDIAKRTARNYKNLEFYVKDIRDLKLKKCDCIILYDVLHHINHKTQLNILRQCYEKLGKGGVLLIKDVNKSFSWKYFRVKILDTITNISNITEGNLCFKSARQFYAMTAKVGFETKVIFPRIRDFTPHVILRCVKK